MPRHIVRLLLLLAAFGIVAFAGIKLFTVDSFYQYGHYRGKSVAEIASETPNYKGVTYCRECHAERVGEWSKGAHNHADAGKIVRCETCHGAAGRREAGGAVAATAQHPTNLKMTVPGDTRQLCTLCHEKTTGRPPEQPQIVVAEHAGTQQCAVCHNPHSPRITVAATTAQLGDVEKGRAKASACAGCHGAGEAGGESLGPRLAGQNAGYLVAAFKAYGSGERDHPMMSSAAQGLSDQDVTDLAAFYASLPCRSVPAAENQAGSATVAKCVACHGPDGASSNKAWPNLAGLSKRHLMEALQAYSSDARKNAMMVGVAKSLSNAEAEAVSTYYAAATCK
jgi:cytochrome c553